MTRIKNNKKNIVIVVSMVLLCMLFSVMETFAVPPIGGEAAYEVKNYDLYAEVNKAHQYTVTETITVNLTDDLNKIEFAIPNGNYKYSSFKVDGIDYIGVEKTIAINDKNRLSRGEHTYVLEYKVKEYMDEDDSRDVYFFDVLPPSWFQPITNLKIRVKYPEDFPVEDIQYFAGQYGVQNVDTKINYNIDKAENMISITSTRIPENLGITLKAILPNNYWQGALSGKWAINLMLTIAIIVFLALLVMWFVGGRDPKPEKVIQTKVVEGISPVEVGYILNGRVSIRDVVSLIVSFGTKGYIKIVEYEPKRYRLLRVCNPGAADEHKYIRNVFEHLFEDVPIGRALEMNEIGHRLRRIKIILDDAVAAGFSSEDMASCTFVSKMFRALGSIILSLSMGMFVVLRDMSVFASVNILEVIIIFIASLFVIFAISDTFDKHYYSAGSTYILGLIGLGMVFVGLVVYLAARTYIITGNLLVAVLSAVLTIGSELFVVVMRARAEGNAVVASKLMQLRHFIYHPSARVLLEEHLVNKNYYYDILPFALIFSGLETWTISFLTLDVPTPSWYSDDVEGQVYSNLRGKNITILDYAKDIRTFARTIEDAYYSLEG